MRLSVVIPAYNEERYLDACLRAIQAQSVMPDEVIVVDNNSTDKTALIAGQYPFVTVIREKKQGLRFARNAGMDAATGDLIGRIDADTIIGPKWCERALQLFANPAIDAATGACSYYDLPAERTSLRLDQLCRKLAFSLEGKPILYGSNMILRHQTWRHLRTKVCMKGSFFEDCDITIHLYEAGLKAVFDRRLVVGASARRLDDNPRQFYNNMKQFDHTYAVHGLRSPTARCAKYIYLLGYPPLKIMRRAYNPKTKNFSLSYFMRSRMLARPTSNT